MTSCEATPPMKAATAWSSAAPKRHISLIRSSVNVEPLQPKSFSTLTAVVFNRDISSSMGLETFSREIILQRSNYRKLQETTGNKSGLFKEQVKVTSVLTHQTPQDNCYNWQRTCQLLLGEYRTPLQHCKHK